MKRSHAEWGKKEERKERGDTHLYHRKSTCAAYAHKNVLLLCSTQYLVLLYILGKATCVVTSQVW